MKLTLEQTKIIKGIAILMMVFLHLFNHITDVEQCTYFLTMGDLPLVHWLTRAANPVPFYLFLSGYGLYYTWSSGKELNPLGRCLKLYQVYWISLLVMVGVGYFIKPSDYPGSIIRVIENVTGWRTSYNAEVWFLFPYLLLVLSSKWLFTWVSKMRGGNNRGNRLRSISRNGLHNFKSISEWWCMAFYYHVGLSTYSLF